MSSNVNHDMIEEFAASLAWGAEKAMKALADVQEIDPGDLVTEMIGAPRAANQLTAALAQLAALGREAAELLEMLP